MPFNAPYGHPGGHAAERGFLRKRLRAIPMKVVFVVNIPTA